MRSVMESSWLDAVPRAGWMVCAGLAGEFRRSASRSSARASSAPPAGSLAMTRTVSSPATVPRMDGQLAWSMTEARNCAAPAGVRTMTRLALASAETSSSAAARASRARGSAPMPAGWSAAPARPAPPAMVPPPATPAPPALPAASAPPATAARPGTGTAWLPRQRVDERPVRAAEPDRAEFLQVTRQRGLGDPDPAVSQPVGELILRAHRSLLQDAGDLGLPGGLGGRAHLAHAGLAGSAGRPGGAG